MLPLLFSFLLLGSTPALTPFLPVPLSGLSVTVDPGHGGVDPGAHFRRELLEKDVVLDIGRNLAEFLSRAGARVVITRTGDNDLAPPEMISLRARKRFDLQQRVALAAENKTDILVSVHINSHPSLRKSGAFVYYNGRPEARELAMAVQKELQGLFTARGCVFAGPDLYILRNAPMPAIIVEAGFISNPAERKALTRAGFRREVAWLVFAGIEKYFQERKGPAFLESYRPFVSFCRRFAAGVKESPPGVENKVATPIPGSKGAGGGTELEKMGAFHVS